MEKMSLEKKWDYFMETSIEFDPEILPNIEMRATTRKIMSDIAVVRADTFFTQNTVRDKDRHGMTFYPKGQRPMIYLNVLRHKGDLEELYDTILHEALHCSALYLNRHDELPEDASTTTYRLEELCVSAGLCKIYPELKIPAMRQKSRSQKAVRDNMLKSLRPHIPETIIEEWVAKGHEAADWLHAIIKAQARS